MNLFNAESAVLTAFAVLLYIMLNWFENYHQGRTIPLCNCPEQNSYHELLSIEYMVGGKVCSFKFCQCAICGGVMGIPSDEFCRFMCSASPAERQEMIDDLYASLYPNVRNSSGRIGF